MLFRSAYSTYIYISTQFRLIPYFQGGGRGHSKSNSMVQSGLKMYNLTGFGLMQQTFSRFPRGSTGSWMAPPIPSSESSVIRICVAGLEILLSG